MKLHCREYSPVCYAVAYIWSFFSGNSFIPSEVHQKSLCCSTECLWEAHEYSLGPLCIAWPEHRGALCVPGLAVMSSSQWIFYPSVVPLGSLQPVSRAGKDERKLKLFGGIQMTCSAVIPSALTPGRSTAAVWEGFLSVAPCKEPEPVAWKFCMTIPYLVVQLVKELPPGQKWLTSLLSIPSCSEGAPKRQKSTGEAFHSKIALPS